MHRFSARRWSLALVAGVFVAAAATARAQEGVKAPKVRPLSYTRFVLPNGLVAILHEDHSAPIVGVHTYYRVGGRDDTKGLLGLAHLFEHMMFQGSRGIPLGQYRPMISAMGGTTAATTSEDRTDYHQTVPSNHLETVLWMESERMSTLPERIDQKSLDAQREVVRNELFSSYENRAFGLANALTVESLFPPNHGYSQGSIGTHADLNAATVEDLKRFFAKWYVPSNAVIAVAGDFNPAEAKRWIEKYYGSIPRGAAVPRSPLPRVDRKTELRVVLDDSRGPGTRLRLAWEGASWTSADRIALNALAPVLAGDRTNGLRKLLIYDRPVATAVDVVHADLEYSGIFQIDVTVRPDVPLTVIEELIDSALVAINAGSLSRTALDRYKTASSIKAITSLERFVNRADTLARGEAEIGNPLAYTRDLAQIAALTPADLQRVAATYLNAGRMVMSLVPSSKRALISKPHLPHTTIVAVSPKA